MLPKTIFIKFAITKTDKRICSLQIVFVPTTLKIFFINYINGMRKGIS